MLNMIWLELFHFKFSVFYFPGTIQSGLQRPNSHIWRQLQPISSDAHCLPLEPAGPDLSGQDRHFWTYKLDFLPHLNAACGCKKKAINFPHVHLGCLDKERMPRCVFQCCPLIRPLLFASFWFQTLFMLQLYVSYCTGHPARLSASSNNVKH